MIRILTLLAAVLLMLYFICFPILFFNLLTFWRTPSKVRKSAFSSGLFLISSFMVLPFTIIFLIFLSAGSLTTLDTPGLLALVALLLPFFTIVYIRRQFLTSLVYKYVVISVVTRSLADVIVVTPFVVLAFLFYFFNQGSVPKIVQVGGNSFLGAFILFNLVNWFNSVSVRAKPNQPAPEPRTQ